MNKILLTSTFALVLTICSAFADAEWKIEARMIDGPKSMTVDQITKQLQHPKTISAADTRDITLERDKACTMGVSRMVPLNATFHAPIQIGLKLTSDGSSYNGSYYHTDLTGKGPTTSKVKNLPSQLTPESPILIEMPRTGDWPSTYLLVTLTDA